MAVTLTTTARNAACNAAVDKVDSAASAGYVEIRDGTTVLCTITFADPAFSAASGGAATGAGMPRSGSASASGDADNYRVYDGDNNHLWSGTAGDGVGFDMDIDIPSIATNDDIQIDSWTHTAPAG